MDPVEPDLVVLDPKLRALPSEALLSIIERQARALRKLQSRNRLLEEGCSGSAATRTQALETGPSRTVDR